MEPFNKKSKCPKCGIADAVAEYCMGVAGPGKACGWGPGDHIHRLCTCCKFQWPEACLDRMLMPEFVDKNCYSRHRHYESKLAGIP